MAAAAAAAADFVPNNSVCVMDASGRVGSSLVEGLLQRGYTVHAAVQSQLSGGDDQLAQCLKRCQSQKLRIFQADFFDYQSVVDALKGCSALFYTFEPSQGHAIYDEYTAEEEVRAAHNVLEACAQTETIDKVVFTSSVTAVIWREDHREHSDFDERHWSDVNFCRKYKLWHGLSKTLAEKTAWALAMDRGINMVTVNAGLVMGPELVSLTEPNYLKGAAEMYEEGVLVTLDLDFLVHAHICVFQHAASYGRYLCFNHRINRPQDALNLTRLLTPPSIPPSLPQSMEQADHKRSIDQRISNKKLNKLMVDFTTRPSLE